MLQLASVASNKARQKKMTTIATFAKSPTASKFSSIKKAIAQIDDTMTARRISVTGNSVKLVIDRPNDGTNGQNSQIAANKKAASVVAEILA